MKLSELLQIFPAPQIPAGFNPAAHEVPSICFDSRRIERDCVFVAIRGEKVDGHRFLKEAVAAGACALVFEDESQVSDGFSGNFSGNFSGVLVKVSSTREALNRLASRFYKDPSSQLFCAGVTGTNGKTTITHMMEAIFNHAGRATGVIGTIDHHLLTASGLKVWKTEMTTPDPVAFQKRLREFVDLQAKVVAMEVSSHALHQSRVDEVPFDVAAFTNLSRDHLDYHRDMDAYFDAKAKLFTELLSRSKKPKPTAVINADDDYGKKLIERTKANGVRVWSYGSQLNADLSFKTLEQNFGGTRFILKTPMGEAEFHVAMPGLHNVYNATAAIGTGLAGGVSLKDCVAALSLFSGVPGRLEPVPNKKGVHIFVDYAHTDGAIETVLHYLRGIRTSSGAKNRIITVFGCGGDRDKGKRPLMMKAAATGSDLVVLTSDNPRTENPEAILSDALAGADAQAVGQTIFIEVDRKKAIRKAIELANRGDVILIAGKGHEDYQQIGTTKYPFRDVAVVKEILQ